MPRSEELDALDEAIARDNARRGWRSVTTTPRRPRPYSFVDQPPPPQKVVKKRSTVLFCHGSWPHTGVCGCECAPENTRIILEAEAKAAEQGRQKIAQLLQELTGDSKIPQSEFDDTWAWVWKEKW